MGEKPYSADYPIVVKDRNSMLDLPPYSVVRTCPYCYHEGETLVTLDGCDCCCNVLLVILKILLLLIFLALIIAVILLVLVLCDSKGGDCKCDANCDAMC